MRLEFESGFIPEPLYRELDFQGYLELFAGDLPIAPHTILRPLQQQNAESHYHELAQLDSILVDHQAEIDLLLQHCRNLPAVDPVLTFFENKKLETFHLYDLGRFVQESLVLEKLETGFPLPDNSQICRQIMQTLLNYLSNDFGSLKLDTAERKLRQAINRTTDQINRELTEYEKRIYQETGIKLVYPFPKEIGKDNKTQDKITNCKLLKLVDKGNVYHLDYVLTTSIKKLVEKNERDQQRWQQQINQKTKALNAVLHPYFQPFSDLYRLRKKRCFDYILLAAKQRHALCLPRFSTEPRILMKDGILPLLKRREQDHYNPLDVSLGSGVNVLFGANMTGKTTVLKTLYFHLMLVKFGLPIPAKTLILNFPDRIGLHLRSSGQADSGLSGFGEEIRFFCGISESPSVYLIDELFHSTDPVNGVELSEAFLTGLTQSSSVFLCTSHYPEVLNIPDITFFKMKDIDADADQQDIDQVLKEVPFEMEAISAKSMKNSSTQTKKPLQIALRFPLPDTILQNIRKKLEN